MERVWYTGRSTALPVPGFVLDFRYVAPFQNEGDSKATGVKSRCHISQLYIPVK